MRSQTGSALVSISDRRSRVGEMRRHGATLAEIGAAVGASTATVWRDVDAIIGDLNERAAEDVAAWRATKLARYAVKLAALDEAIEAADTPERVALLVTAWVRVDAAEARLLGTDMPSRHHVVAETVTPMTEERAREILAEMKEFEGR